MVTRVGLLAEQLGLVVEKLLGYSQSTLVSLGASPQLCRLPERLAACGHRWTLAGLDRAGGV